MLPLPKQSPAHRVPMSDERPDIRTRFKKGQSGNPRGRPKGRKDDASLLRDVFYQKIAIRDQRGTRNVPKIVAAAEVCLNNAIKGDLRSFAKLMEIAQKFQLIQTVPISDHYEEIVEIRTTIVDPKVSDEPMDVEEYFAREKSA